MCLAERTVLSISYCWGISAMSVPWITSTHLFAASVHKIIATNTSLTVRGCECCFKRNWTEHEFEPWMVKKEKRPSVRPLVVLCRLYTVQAALTRGSVCVSVQDEAIKCVPQDWVCVPVWVEEDGRKKKELNLSFGGTTWQNIKRHIS